MVLSLQNVFSFVKSDINFRVLINSLIFFFLSFGFLSGAVYLYITSSYLGVFCSLSVYFLIVFYNRNRLHLTYIYLTYDTFLLFTLLNIIVGISLFFVNLHDSLEYHLSNFNPMDIKSILNPSSSNLGNNPGGAGPAGPGGPGGPGGNQPIPLAPVQDQHGNTGGEQGNIQGVPANTQGVPANTAGGPANTAGGQANTNVGVVQSTLNNPYARLADELQVLAEETLRENIQRESKSVKFGDLNTTEEQRRLMFSYLAGSENRMLRSTRYNSDGFVVYGHIKKYAGLDIMRNTR